MQDNSNSIDQQYSFVGTNVDESDDGITNKEYTNGLNRRGGAA